MINHDEILNIIMQGTVPSFKSTTVQELANLFRSITSSEKENVDLLLLGIEEYYSRNPIREEIKSFEDFFSVALIFDRDKNGINRFFDAVLGIRSLANLAKFDQISEEKNSGQAETLRVRGSFEYSHTQTHYSILLDIFNYLRPDNGEVIIDIGSGFGRVGCFIGLCFPQVKYIGYEIISDRVECSKKIADKNSFYNIEFHNENILSENFNIRPAQYYYFYDPLEKEDLNHFTRKLKENSSRFKVIALSGYDENILEYFNSESWLDPVRPIKDDFFKVTGCIYDKLTT